MTSCQSQLVLIVDCYSIDQYTVWLSARAIGYIVTASYVAT